MKTFLFILFIILAVIFSELLSLYLKDITAYMGGFTIAVFIYSQFNIDNYVNCNRSNRTRN